LHATDRQVFIITFLKIVKFNLIIIIGLSDWIHLQARLREAASAGKWKGRSLYHRNRQQDVASKNLAPSRR
jgi:hypothetical protein